MVIAEEPITAIIPARPIAHHGNRYSEEPVLEVKHKTSSRHEKRTKRDSYKYSGDSNQPPIEYVYTYSEETPKRSTGPDGEKTSTDLVPINGNGPGKIECTVGEDGNLVVKIRGKPDSVPLDPDKLPIVLPEGWQLKEIQTNQRSRKIERSRKTRIKDEIFVSGEESEKAVVLYNEHTHAVNGHESVHDEVEDRNYGHADEEEYTHGEHNGITYVHKKSRKYEEGPAGLTSRIEESHTKEGVDFDHPNNKQRSSKSTHSLLERTENSKRKFSKQSVTDEKVTETHKSNVRYFDGDSSSAPGLRQDLRDHTTNIQSTEQNYYGRSDTTRGRTDEQRDHDIIIESPEDTPYNSLDRRDRRHHHNEEEIIDIDDRYRYHDDDYNTREDTRTDKRVETSGYVASYRAPRDQRTETERRTDRTEEEYSLYKDQNGRSVNGGPHSDRYDETTDRRQTEERTYYDKRRRTSDTSDVSSRRGQNQLNGYPSGTNIHENIERTSVTERYRYGTPDRPVNNLTSSRTDIEEREDRASLIENRRNDYPERQPQNWSTRTDREDREERTSVTGSYLPFYPDRQPDTRTTRTDTEEREERTSVTGSYRPYRPTSETTTTRKEEREERYLDEEFPDSVSVLQQPANRTDLATRTDREDKEERTLVVENYRNGYPERQPVPNRPVNYSTRSDKEDREERTSITGTYRPLPQQNVYPASTDDRLDTTRVEKEERTDIYGNFPSPGQPDQRTVPYRQDYNQDTTTRTDQYEERVDVTKDYDQPRTQRVPLDNRVDQTSTNTERRENYFISDERPVDHRPVLVDRPEYREERREETEERHLYDNPTNRPLATVSRTHNEEVHKEVRDFPGPRVHQPHHEEERFAEKVEQEVFRSPSEVRRQPTLHNNTSTTTTTKRSEIVDKYLDQSEGIGPSTHQHLPDSRTQHFSQSTELTHLRDTRQESLHFKPVDEHQTSSATRHDTLATQVDMMDEGKSSPQSRDRKGAKDRVTIDDRYRVIGSSEERPGPTAHHHRPLVTDQRTDKSTYQRKDTTKEVEERRTHSRLTDISSTGERIVPVAVGPTPAHPNDFRRDSAVSSVDLSEIKSGEHLDNRALKDRGNLAQNGSLGQRRPPSRNPVKFPHFGDENAVPEDFLSTSDTTLPTPLRPSRQRPQHPTSGRFSAATDAGTMIDKSHTSSTTRQQNMRDERVLINYTDKTDKPDWVRNIDDHFSNRRNVNIHYARENVTSPTPRIEEIATIAGSTVITVNGEDKPVHGIVTEPGDRPLLSFAQPIEKDVVHQSEKGSRSGFTRVTESKGYKQSAKEQVQYQERRENVRQISVSYDIPGKGKHVREYTWTGQQEKPDEKITFQEERRHTKDVNMILGLDKPRPYVPSPPTTTETTRTVDRQEKIVFAEERPQPARDVSVNIGLQEEVKKMEVSRRPIEANTFRFEEERKHERQVDMVVGLNEDVYYEPPPQEKIVFQEEREVKKDVSVTLGLEDYETAPPFEPLPVEKFTFEETRVIPAQHDVALIFGIDEPPSQPPVLIPPRPISTPSESTVVTQPIVPQYVKPREETKKFERIVEERREDTRLTALTDIIPPTPQPPRVVHERVQEVKKFEEYIIKREQPKVVHEQVQEVEKAEEYVIHREQPKVVAKAEVIPPSAKIIAATEIIPPPPRTVSMTAAIDSAAVYHDEVGLVPEEPHIFETSVALQGRQKRERVEQLLQMEKPPPAPLPPTSGRVEKHVHLETIVPEPTGEPLPQSLGLYGYTYKATIEPKKPEFEPSIEFHVIESERPVETIEETVEKIDWYIKEGKAPSEIPDDVSSIGEVRAATPPRHPELTATAEIVPPTHVVASAEITPPGARQAKVEKQTHLSASAEIVPPKKQKPSTVEEIPTFHYGEDQEDRLSLISGSWEEHEKPQPQRPNVTRQPFETLSKAKVEDRKVKSLEKVEATIGQPPPPPPKRNQRNDFSRAPKGQADRTELSEIHFDTPEEEERWKSSLQRHAVPQPKRAQQDVQLERPREEPARPLPKPSGRIPRKTWSEKLDTEHAGHLQKALGTYGYLYTATLNPQAVVPHGLPLDVEQIDTTETKIDLDVQQALLTAFIEIIPPLTPKQQHQLLIASVEIFPPLTAEQQRSLLNALVMIHPALSINQQRQLLEGKEITPPLTVEQQQQLATISADIVPGLTLKQHKQLLYATLQITPPLTEDQQEQLLIAVAEIFPPPPPRKRVKILDRDELSEEEEEEVDYLIKARRKQEEKKRAEERRKTVERYEKNEEEEIDVDYLLKTGREQENKRTKGRINDRGIWEKTSETETVERTETSFMEEARKKFDKKEERAEWIEKTRHLQTGETSHDRSEISYDRNERHVVHGMYPRDKEVSLQQKRYLSEQTTHLEDDAVDLEVSAINMNINPRIKSQILLMAPSPPLPRPYSPATGSGFRYTASPQISTPPMTDTSGFMYEAIVDGHGSPMSQELGRYGFTYQATLDGSETYRKMAESTHQLEINQIESRRQESSSTSPDTPKRLSATPPWSTPPITPIPAPAATPPRDTTSRDNTPLPGVRDLGSTSTAWKKTDWGRSVYEKNVQTTGTKKPLQPIEASFPVDSAHRHELRGNVYSPEEEIHERITENVIRRRQEMDSSYEESQRIADETSKWLEKTTVARPPTDVKEPPANWKCEYPIVEEPGSDAGRPPGQEIVEETRMTLTETITRRHGELTVPRGTDPSLIPAMFEVAEAEDELKRRTEAMKMGSSNKTTTSKPTSDQGSNYRGDTKTENYTRTSTSRDDKQTSQNKSNIPPGKTSPQADGRPTSSASQYSNVSDRSFGSSASQNKFRTTSREERFDEQHETTIKKKEERTEKIVSFADEHKSDQTVPEWVRLVEERKRRSQPQQQYFRSDKYAKKEPVQPKPRQLEELPEEDPLEAALERIATDRRAAQQSDGSPSSLRKWGNVGALSSAATTNTSSKNDSSFNKGFRKHTTETKEVIEESRFHSEQAMLEAIESASAGNSNLLSTMSQSMPSLAHTRRMEGSNFGDITRSNDDMVLSMEELSRSNTKLKRTDGAEEEVKDFSFARRGDTVSPETKRTKRTVVRKLVNGEWKEVAVREEDMPAEDMAMELHAAQPTDRILAQLQHRDEDQWSLSDAVIEETTTTRTIRRVEEEEEDIISVAGTDA
ncbi:hypothetical protein RvY_14510 [Ramazzottius varieornatus]|uniref:Uncharacterized protein n=1 Tax=Ramazzottius varieornatus TaxID=947166 RepID=A0A1D1VWP2_RAMVA|nr:hypothetical protein RvY_14510 [Ramazzottius varieornatus]